MIGPENSGFCVLKSHVLFPDGFSSYQQEKGGQIPREVMW